MICHNDHLADDLDHEYDPDRHQPTLSNQTFSTALVTRIFMYYLYPTTKNKHYCSNKIAFS